MILVQNDPGKHVCDCKQEANLCVCVCVCVCGFLEEAGFQTTRSIILAVLADLIIYESISVRFQASFRAGTGCKCSVRHSSSRNAGC